jgi:hypothetical protein
MSSEWSKKGGLLLLQASRIFVSLHILKILFSEINDFFSKNTHKNWNFFLIFGAKFKKSANFCWTVSLENFTDLRK